MQAGALRHRVTLTPVTAGSRDALGAPARTMGAPATLWAKVEPVGANERFDQAQFQVRPTHRITIRYREGVTHRDELTFRDQSFDIVGVQDPDERRVMLDLLCTARKPGVAT